MILFVSMKPFITHYTSKIGLFCLILLVYNNLLYAQLFPNLGGQRAGISSFPSLKSDISPRAIALSGAMTTLEGDAYSSHWNPATMVDLNSINIGLSTRMYPMGVSHHFVGATYRISPTDLVALSINNLTSGYMKERTEFFPGGTGVEFAANTMALGVSYAKEITYKFSFGATVKFIQETYDLFRANALAVDAGFIYKTDYKGLRFGAFLQNFGGNTRATGSANNFSFVNKAFTPDAYPVPLVFKFGASFVPLKTEIHHLNAAAEVNHPNDNATNVRMGLEYSYQYIVFFRAGYAINMAAMSIPTAGMGLRINYKDHKMFINYAFTSSNAFGLNHNVGVSIYINKNSSVQAQE